MYYLSLATYPFSLYYTPGVSRNPIWVIKANLSLVTCHLPLVTCCLSLVICHLSFVTCHLSLGIDSIILLESQGIRKHMTRWVIKANLPFVTCNLPLVTCHLLLVTCHLSLFTLLYSWSLKGSKNISHMGHKSKHVTCHLSLATCHLLLFTCYLSFVTCHLSFATYHLSLGIDSIILLESQGFQKHMT